MACSVAVLFLYMCAKCLFYTVNKKYFYRSRTQYRILGSHKHHIYVLYIYTSAYITPP